MTQRVFKWTPKAKRKSQMTMTSARGGVQVQRERMADVLGQTRATGQGKAYNFALRPLSERA
jgi:hypothetical protein